MTECRSKSVSNCQQFFESEMIFVCLCCMPWYVIFERCYVAQSGRAPFYSVSTVQYWWWTQISCACISVRTSVCVWNDWSRGKQQREAGAKRRRIKFVFVTNWSWSEWLNVSLCICNTATEQVQVKENVFSFRNLVRFENTTKYWHFTPLTELNSFNWNLQVDWFWKKNPFLLFYDSICSMTTCFR